MPVEKEKTTIIELVKFSLNDHTLLYVHTQTTHTVKPACENQQFLKSDKNSIIYILVVRPFQFQKEKKANSAAVTNITNRQRVV